MTINVTQFAEDLAAKLMKNGSGVFQGLQIQYFHRTQNAHVPGQSYSGPSFASPPVVANAILEAPGMNEIRQPDPAKLHTRRVFVRRAELPPEIDIGDKWLEPSGIAYEVSVLVVGDPGSATLWLIGERSVAP